MGRKRIPVSPRPCSGRRVHANKRPRVEGLESTVKKLQRREIGAKRDRAFNTSHSQERFWNIRLQVGGFCCVGLYCFDCFLLCILWVCICIFFLGSFWYGFIRLLWFFDYIVVWSRIYDLNLERLWAHLFAWKWIPRELMVRWGPHKWLLKKWVVKNIRWRCRWDLYFPRIWISRVMNGYSFLISP